MNIDEFLRTGAVRMQMQSFKDKESRAIDLCAKLLEEHDAPYVALSGGKDSVAMAYIVDQAACSVRKDFHLWLHLSDASFPGTLETCRLVAKSISRQLDVSESERSAFELLAETDQRRAFGKSGVFFDSVRKYAKDKDLAFVGVRAKESKRRSKAARIHGQVFHSASMGNVDVCHPLLWFDIFDVAATLVKNVAPIHPIYRKMPINNAVTNSQLEAEFIRLGYITSRDLLNKGTAVFLKVNYPDLFNKTAEIYPEIKSFL